MEDSIVFRQDKASDGMIQVFADMQMNYLAKSYSEPCAIEMELTKVFGEYKSSLLFTCSHFSFLVNSKSWSPYKAMELTTVLARDEILQRFYNSCSYA